MRWRTAGFDSHIASLGYHTPTHVRAAFERAIGELGLSLAWTASHWTMFDAGVGTGLAGAHMHGVVSRMIGVCWEGRRTAMI